MYKLISNPNCNYLNKTAPSELNLNQNRLNELICKLTELLNDYDRPGIKHITDILCQVFGRIFRVYKKDVYIFDEKILRWGLVCDYDRFIKLYLHEALNKISEKSVNVSSIIRIINSNMLYQHFKNVITDESSKIFDLNVNILSCFDGKVIDFNEGCLRDGVPEDLCETSLPISLVQPTAENLLKLNQYLEQVFPNFFMRKQALDIFSNCLANVKYIKPIILSNDSGLFKELIGNVFGCCFRDTGYSYYKYNPNYRLIFDTVAMDNNEYHSLNYIGNRILKIDRHASTWFKCNNSKKILTYLRHNAQSCNLFENIIYLEIYDKPITITKDLLETFLWVLFQRYLENKNRTSIFDYFSSSIESYLSCGCEVCKNHFVKTNLPMFMIVSELREFLITDIISYILNLLITL